MWQLLQMIPSYCIMFFLCTDSSLHSCTEVQDEVLAIVGSHSAAGNSDHSGHRTIIL